MAVKKWKLLAAAALIVALAMPLAASEGVQNNPVIDECPVCRVLQGMEDFWQWLTGFLGGENEPNSHHAHPWRDADPGKQ